MTTAPPPFRRLPAGRRAPARPETADPVDVMVGAAIRRARRERGLSQQALAMLLGVSGQQLQKYESAANRVSASVLFRIARILDCPPGAFFPPRDAAMTTIDLEGLLASAEVMTLLSVFVRIEPSVRRQALVTVAEGLAAAKT